MGRRLVLPQPFGGWRSALSSGAPGAYIPVIFTPLAAGIAHPAAALRRWPEGLWGRIVGIPAWMRRRWVADPDLLVFCRLVLLRGPADNPARWTAGLITGSSSRNGEEGNAMPVRLFSKSVLATRLLWTCLNLTGSARGATYWVSPDGQAAWAACLGATPLTGIASCNISTANLNAVAEIPSTCGGALPRELLHQTHQSRHPGSPIAFEAYNNEVVVVTPQPVANGDHEGRRGPPTWSER